MIKNYKIPNWRRSGNMNADDGSLVKQFIDDRIRYNYPTAQQTVVAYTHGATCVNNAYISGVLAPNGRLYMIPYAQATAAVWHYINTLPNNVLNDPGKVLAYTHGATCVSNAYAGGVLARNGRIYMIPFRQGLASYSSVYPPAHSDTYVKATTKYNTSYWPYYATDPAKSLTGSYINNAWISVNGTYTNQRFHIDLGSAKVINRIYYENIHTGGSNTQYGAKNFTLWGSNSATSFAELTYGTNTGWTQITGLSQTYFDQHVAANQADPKYITIDGNVTAYRYYAFKIADNWVGSTWMGIRRLVLQENINDWHYIDLDGTVKAYKHGVNTATQPYYGGVMSPNGRIYMVPYNRATSTTWHYIDTDGTVVAYTHGATCVRYAYAGGVLAPNGRIYLTPFYQSTETYWHYIDTDGTVVAYTHTSSEMCVNGALGLDGSIYFNHVNKVTKINTEDNTSVQLDVALGRGVALSPNGRIYQTPYQSTATSTTWQYIDVMNDIIVSYSHGLNVADISPYISKGYVCDEFGKLWVIPYGQATMSKWFYIDTNPTYNFPRPLVTSPYMNNH